MVADRVARAAGQDWPRLVHHARYAVFQVAGAALPQQVFAGIRTLINGLRGPPIATASA